MQFRILSDLHITNNSEHYSGLNSLDYVCSQIDSSKDRENNIITLIAGDITHDRQLRKDFFNNNPNMQGVFVEGNHMVYTTPKQPIREYIQELREDFPIDSNMAYLENDVKDFGDFVVIGATLWTDFKLYANNTNAEAMAMAKAMHVMNDYVYGRVDKDTRMTPEHTQQFFNISFNYIQNMVNKYKDRKVIVLTHHCPSEKCIQLQFRKDQSMNSLNPAYASNLDDFIINNPNIKAWVCGHCHSPKQFMIGDTQIIMNPFGYTHEQVPNFKNNQTYNLL